MPEALLLLVESLESHQFSGNFSKDSPQMQNSSEGCLTRSRFGLILRLEDVDSSFPFDLLYPLLPNLNQTGLHSAARRQSFMLCPRILLPNRDHTVSQQK